MTRAQYMNLIRAADCLIRSEDQKPLRGYWTCYKAGLRRGYYGARFVSDEAHELNVGLCSAADEERQVLGRGYSNGLAAIVRGPEPPKQGVMLRRLPVSEELRNELQCKADSMGVSLAALRVKSYEAYLGVDKSITL